MDLITDWVDRPLNSPRASSSTPSRDRRSEVGYHALVLPVVADERLQRPGVLLRVVPTAVLPRGKQPAYERPNLGLVRPGAHERVQRDRGRAHVRIPEPQQVGIAELLDMRSTGLGQDGVGDAAPQIGDAGARRLTLHEQGVVQVGEREHRHAIAIPVDPRQVRILIPASFDEHLHGERLPGRIRRPPSLVLRRRAGEPLLEVAVAVAHDGRRDLVFQIDGRLEDVEQVAREVRRRVVAVTGPVDEAAVAALELLELAQRLLRGRTHACVIDAGQVERLPEIAGQYQRQRARSSLFRAAVWIFDEIARPLAEAGQGRRCQLDVQAAKSRNDPVGNLDHFGRHGLVRRTVGGHGFRRGENLDGDRVFEGVGLGAGTDRHLHAGTADRLPGGLEPHLHRATGAYIARAARPGRESSTPTDRGCES